MASIKSGKKGCGFILASLPMPDGTRMAYRESGKGAHARMMRKWKLDCRLILAGMRKTQIRLLIMEAELLKPAPGNPWKTLNRHF